jgi:hypothetical protein
MSVDDYLADRHAVQGGRCMDCLSDVDITTDAYVDALEGDTDLRLVCAECGAKRELVLQTDDAVPTRTVHWTRSAATRRTWHGVFRWELSNPSDRTRIIAHAESLARRRLLEDSIEGYATMDMTAQLNASFSTPVLRDREDHEAARVLREIASELDGRR